MTTFVLFQRQLCQISWQTGILQLSIISGVWTQNATWMGALIRTSCLQPWRKGWKSVIVFAMYGIFWRGPARRKQMLDVMNLKRDTCGVFGDVKNVETTDVNSVLCPTVSTRVAWPSVGHVSVTCAPVGKWCVSSAAARFFDCQCAQVWGPCHL